MKKEDVKFVVIAFIKMGDKGRRMALYDFRVDNDAGRFLHDLSHENDYYLAKQKPVKELGRVVDIARCLNKAESKKNSKKVMMTVPDTPKSTPSSRK